MGARRVKVRLVPHSVLGWGKVAVVPTLPGSIVGLFNRQLMGASVFPSIQVLSVSCAMSKFLWVLVAKYMMSRLISPIFSFCTWPSDRPCLEVMILELILEG